MEFGSNLPNPMTAIKSFLSENFNKSSYRNNSGKQRIEFIDLAKGICIILVVVLHASSDDGIPLLMALRMPLYFVLSGLFFKSYDSFYSFIIKKINRLLIPLLFFIFIGFILAMMLRSPMENLKIFFSNPVTFNFPLWFLICLFEVNIIYYIIQSISANSYLQTLIVLAFGLMGMALDYYNIFLPIYLDSAFSATPFFFAGTILRQCPILYNSKHEKKILLLGIVLIAASVTYCITKYTPFIGFVENTYYNGNYIEILLVSISSVTGLLIICKAIKWLPVISYIGRFSIIVLGLHTILMNYAYLTINKLSGHELSPYQQIYLTLLLCWISIPIFKKLFPKFTAQQDLIKSYHCRQKSYNYDIKTNT